MKKTLLALAALSAYAGIAQADESASALSGSSVTLYGVFDASIHYISDVQVAQDKGENGRRGKPLYGMSGAGLQQIRFGLQVVEKLNNNMAALAVLAGGVNFNNGRSGQGGILFGRIAQGGLTGDFGTLTLGRQGDTLGDFVGSLQASNRWGSQTAHPGNVDEGVQLNNSIKFASPDFNGFSFGGQYSFGNVVGKISEKQAWTVGAGYKYGPLALGVGYLKAHHPNLSIYGNNTDDKSQNHVGFAGLTGEQENTIFSGYASARWLEIVGAGFNVTAGPVLFGATYANKMGRASCRER